MRVERRRERCEGRQLKLHQQGRQACLRRLVGVPGQERAGAYGNRRKGWLGARP